MSVVHVVLPEGTDDPGRPSGGHVYNRRLCRGLAQAGWAVREHAVPGAWPEPDADDQRCLADALATVSDRGVVLVDGLVASAAPRVVAAAAGRLDLVVLVHMPLGEVWPHLRRGESATLSAARAVITTSRWTRARIIERYAVPPGSVHVARPGAEPGTPAYGTATGGELLCVAAVAPHKGQDVLLSALERLPERAWHCRLAGALDQDVSFVSLLRARTTRPRLRGRVDFCGPLTRPALERAYVGSDLLVLPSHRETYGMVVTEALAHGLPVIATAVGGVAEALGRARNGRLPGVLVPDGDACALAAALGDWLERPACRARLREDARDRRTTLPRWEDTYRQVAAVLTPVPSRVPS